MRVRIVSVALSTVGLIGLLVAGGAPGIARR